jgi:hypothetical protein
MARRKNAAAYHVKRSAVKKIHREKRGIDKASDINPKAAAHLGSRLKIKNKRIIKNAIS